MADEYITTREAAQMLRLTPTTVARYAKQRRIGGAEKAGNRYRILRAEFRLLPDTEEQAPHPVGRPPSSSSHRRGTTLARTPRASTEGPSLREKLEVIRRKYAV